MVAEGFDSGRGPASPVTLQSQRAHESESGLRQNSGGGEQRRRLIGL